MKQAITLIQLSERGQITLPSEVRKTLGLRGGDAFQVRIEEGRVVLEPVEVTPVELYTDERIEAFLESAEMSEEQLRQARKAWNL